MVSTLFPICTQQFSKTRLSRTSKYFWAKGLAEGYSISLCMCHILSPLCVLGFTFDTFCCQSSIQSYPCYIPIMIPIKLHSQASQTISRIPDSSAHLAQRRPFLQVIVTSPRFAKICSALLLPIPGIRTGRDRRPCSGYGRLWKRQGARSHTGVSTRSRSRQERLVSLS